MMKTVLCDWARAKQEHLRNRSSMVVEQGDGASEILSFCSITSMV